MLGNPDGVSRIVVITPGLQQPRSGIVKLRVVDDGGKTKNKNMMILSAAPGFQSPPR